MRSRSRRPHPLSLSAGQPERDACGVGFIASIKGERTHNLVEKGLEALIRLEHRGACGCDPESGDGAGILVHLPHEFFAAVCGEAKIKLPEPGKYGAGMVFLPPSASAQSKARKLLDKAVTEAGLSVLGWRDVPIDEEHCGRVSLSTRPHIAQIFVAPTSEIDEDALERRLFLARKIAANAADSAGGQVAEHYYIVSMSCRTMVYKGMLISTQLPAFFPDLCDERFKSAIALVHSRFSTNTLPTWRLAQPFRYLAHNGEINTVRGNVNWMTARERLFESPLFGDDISKLLPIIAPRQSDSAVFDNGLELLYHTGRTLPHSVMMMIPEAWEKHESMAEEKKDFYRYHAALMEPWDGPASIAFSDGRGIGAVLDRNGLRPSRYLVTKDDIVVMASETGVYDVPARNVVLKDRLQPGRMFYVDLERQHIIEDGQLKHEIATRKPYGTWIRQTQVSIGDLPAPKKVVPHFDDQDLLTQQQLFGYTLEDLRVLLSPMALNGQEPVGSMGTDTPLACLSDRPQLLFNYFKQLFAQVTNPPIDPIREELVMGLDVAIGRQSNLFEDSPEHCRQLSLAQPILTNEQLAQIRELDVNGIRSTTVTTLFPAGSGAKGLDKALTEICAAASKAVEDGFDILILSDRGAGADQMPVPSLLAVGAVHHHLIRTGMRTRIGIVVESGEPREVMHYCLLFGYGASAVNPYLTMATLVDLAGEGELHGHSEQEAVANYVKAVGKGLLKTMSKMGISTLASYRGAQIFEAIGLAEEVVERCFTWTPSRIRGIGMDVIAQEVAMRHHRAFLSTAAEDLHLDPGGQYQWRRRGEFHLFNPQTVAKLQHAVRSGNYDLFKKYSSLVNDQSRNLCTLRSMLKLKKGRPSVPLDEVEPASEIVKRFKTGAMSFGSISKEARRVSSATRTAIGAAARSSRSPRAASA